MKKFCVLILAFTLIFTMAACGGDSDESSGGTSSAATASGTESSSAATSSVAGNSSADATSGNTSSDVTPEPTLMQFITFKAQDTASSATSDWAFKLTNINNDISEGDVAVLNFDYGSTIAVSGETYEDYAIYVVEYLQSSMSYHITETYEVGADNAKQDVAIPDDGYVLIVHKDKTDVIQKIAKYKEEEIVINGFQDYNTLETISNKKVTIDGVINASEYGDPIWVVNENNDKWTYLKFPDNDYYVTAKIYMTYDEDNLYVGVLVETPDHYCPVKKDAPDGMYNYYCLQVNFSSEDPAGEYMAKNFDHIINKTAQTENVLRQYGFGLSSEEGVGEVIANYMYGTGAKNFAGEFKAVRDDGEQTTTYEIALPWAELGTTDDPFNPVKGDIIGFSVSINASTQADYTGSPRVWKNITMRNGGGIIGRNDWTKIPRIELG